jgi:UPF0716 protein FxsA
MGATSLVVEWQATAMTPGRVGCLLLLWPVAELVLLLIAASAWGWQTVLLILLAGLLVGLIIARLGVNATGRSWAQAMRLLQRRSSVVDPETGEVFQIESMATLDNADLAPPAQTTLVIVAGLLIAVPGFLSDIGGLVLLIPAVRRRIARRPQI